MPETRLVPCRRCGKQVNADAVRCPWCGYRRRFQSVLPIAVLVLVGIALMFASGLLTWEMVEDTFRSAPRGR